jgi:type IV secretory pathway TrbF-like protein
MAASTIGGPFEPEQVAQNLSKATWQVRWTEEASGLDGSPVATTHWEAALDTTIISATSDSSILENPLGFYVTQLNWTEQRS